MKKFRKLACHNKLSMVLTLLEEDKGFHVESRKK